MPASSVAQVVAPILLPNPPDIFLSSNLSKPENEKYLADFVEKARLFDSPMATTTRYHLLPDDNRPSQDENAANDERLIASVQSINSPKKKRLQCSSHATIYTRFAVICLLVPSFVILIIPGYPQTLPIEVFGMICVIRNGWILLSHLIPPCFRIRIEIVGRSPSLPIKRSYPPWLKRRYIEMAIDVLIWIPLFVSTTVIGSRPKRCGRGYWGAQWYACNNSAFVPAMVMTWLACAFYLFSIIDGGKPGSVKASAGLAYDEEDAPVDDAPPVQA